MGDKNPIRTLRDYSKPSNEGYKNTIELPIGNNVVPLRSDTIRLVQNGCSFHGLQSEDPNQHLKDFLKLVDSLAPATAKLRNDILMFQQHHEESLAEAWTRFKDLLQKVPHHSIDLWLQALLEDLSLYENKSWNDPRDFTKLVKAITLPQDVPSTSDRCLIELENQVQRLMKVHRAPMQPTQVNKVTTSCEICSHDTQYCMEDPEKAFVEYASSRTNKTGSRPFTMNQGPRSFNEVVNAWKEKPNFNWAHAQTFTNPQNGSLFTYSSNYQTKLEKALVNFDSHQEKRLSSLRTQLGQQQDDMTSKVNLLWKTVSEKLDDTPL
ncbi:hypothetical protein Tco_1218831 [Tanacetum coccineum]